MIVVVISFIAALLFGGGETEYFLVSALDKGVNSCVVDKEDKKLVKAQLKVGKKEINLYYKFRKANIKEFKSLYLSYNTADTDFDSFFDNQDEEIQKVQALVFETRVSCLKHITASEWDCILQKSEKSTTKLKKAAQKAYDKQSFEKVREAILKHILLQPDQALALASLDTLEKSYRQLATSLMERNEIDNELIRDYSSSVEELGTIALKINKDRHTAFYDLVEFYMEMQKLTNENEWKAISKQLIKSLNI